MIGLKDEEEIENLARYLIEDNSEDLVLYDENLSLGLSIVKSILRKMLNAYEIRNSDETQQYRNQIKEVSLFGDSALISQFLTDKNDSLKEAIERMESDLHRKHCTIQELEVYFKVYDLHFKREYEEQIYLDMYLPSRDLDKLSLTELSRLYVRQPEVEED